MQLIIIDMHLEQSKVIFVIFVISKFDSNCWLFKIDIISDEIFD